MNVPGLRRLLNIGISSLALTGCGDTIGPEKTLLPVDSNIVFQVSEGYGAVGDPYPRSDAVTIPRVVLKLRTAKEYGCSNYEIEYEKTVSSDRVHIQLLGTSIGPVCLTSTGPATARMFLDFSTGSYELILASGSDIATFHVTVTDSALSITPSAEAFARSEYAVYWRHPPKSLAYYCGTTVETRSMCDEFVDRLAAAVQIEEFSFPPQGQTPWAVVSDGNYYNAPTRFFRYSEESDFEAAGVVLETFAKEVIGAQQGITLSLWSWRNERHLSWLYREP